MVDSPLQRYTSDLAAGYQPDAAQKHAIELLDELSRQLAAPSAKASWVRAKLDTGSLWQRMRNALQPLPAVPQGLYFWGGVGRGKTYLMDLFFEALPFEQKLRTHFHRFMRSVHKELKTLPEQANPLDIVAEKIAQDTRVICFDEFFVVDITDAMILANLLRALFARGVVLVATSNIEPNGLYRDGLQRARFLPAIGLLNQHTQVVNVDGGIDYRLRALEQLPLYQWPHSEQAVTQLQACFNDLVSEHEVIRQNCTVEIEGRHIAVKRLADGVVWFDFLALCDGPRSQNDYIELAREFHTVIVAGVPAFTAANDDQARRFIYLVDEFYDRGVKLILSADLPLAELYGDGRLGFEFERTMSRLREMQSTDYLARAHKS